MTPQEVATTQRETTSPRAGSPIRLGATEWVVGLGLLFGSLPGPWLTIAFPAGAAFALFDRRRVARWAGVVVAALAALLALGSPAGAVLLVAATAAGAGVAVATARGRSGLDGTALPALAAAAAALAAGALVARGSVAAWEDALGGAIEEGSALALDRYRALGVDPATLEAIEAATGTVAEWTVAAWPALVAAALWLGAWLAGRLVGRWGSPPREVAARLAGPGFGAFRLGDAWLWVLIAALAALWLPETRRIGANAALAAGALHAAQGLAVVDRGFERRGWGRLARVLVPGAAVALVPPVALGGAVAIGLTDHWMGFRDRAAGDG